MNVLLVCAGGMSTSILMKKMEKYAEANGIELQIVAKGVNEYEEIYQDYDVILLGPQISYKRGEIESFSQKPLAVIEPYDYAIGNVENIFRQINKLLS